MKLDVSVTHRLSQDEAVRRVKALFDKAKTEHAGKLGELHEQWDKHVGYFRASLRGMSGSATVSVVPGRVIVSCDLPAVAFLYKSTIKRELEERLAVALADSSTVRRPQPTDASNDDGEFVPHDVPAFLKKRVRLPKTPPLSSDDTRYTRAYFDIVHKIERGVELSEEEREWYMKEKTRMRTESDKALRENLPFIVLVVTVCIVWIVWPK